MAWRSSKQNILPRLSASLALHSHSIVPQQDTIASIAVVVSWAADSELNSQAMKNINARRPCHCQPTMALNNLFD